VLLPHRQQRWHGAPNVTDEWTLRTASIDDGECPRWVNSCPGSVNVGCPLYPRYLPRLSRTGVSFVGQSATCGLCTMLPVSSALWQNSRVKNLGLGFMMRPITILACAGMLMLLPATAFAQAGSTGGTVGKTDKSVSGEAAPQSPPQPERHTAKPTIASRSNEVSGSCGKFVGAWEWTHIGIITVVFKSDGTAEASNGYNGSWGCQSGILNVTWSGGVTFRLAISPDGRHFASTSNVLGLPVSGVRK
jgi:hypothetical protein